MSSSSVLSNTSLFWSEAGCGIIKSKVCFYQFKHYKQKD